MFEDVVGTSGARFLIAAAAVAAGLALLALVLWFMRNRASSPFVRGGKNRQPRLAVLDAAAVDTRRRLVLVRRDDVEHLIMIGGPTDIVIESRIVGARPIGDQPGATALPAPQPIALPAAALPAPAAALQRPEAPPAPAARIPVERRADARPASRPEPSTEPKAEPRAGPRPAPPPVSAMGQALYGEEASPPRPQAPRPAAAAQPRTVAPAEPARPSSVATGRTPEDILDAARSRVLPQAPTQALTQAPTQAPAARTEPASRDDAREFERLLDAQISGELGRLGPAAPAAQRPPAIEPPRPAGRTEPSLEEEMNRMLNEMGNERKS